MRFPLRRGALILALMATAIVPNTASAAVDEQALVVSIAQAQIGKPFRMGTQGLARFDCSGLIYFVYAQSGIVDRIGGRRLTADGYMKWGRQRGLLSRTDPRVGDLVLWKYARDTRIRHSGIYVGVNVKGQPLAISALTTGVAKHKILTISVPFFSYVHTGLGLRPDPPTPPPSPSPTPTTEPSPSPTATPTPTPTPIAP